MSIALPPQTHKSIIPYHVSNLKKGDTLLADIRDDNMTDYFIGVMKFLGFYKRGWSRFGVTARIIKTYGFHQKNQNMHPWQITMPLCHCFLQEAHMFDSSDESYDPDGKKYYFRDEGSLIIDE